MADLGDKECAICLDKTRKPVRLGCGHIFCCGCLDGWRSKFGNRAGFGDGDKNVWDKGCPLCREKLPPSKEMIAQLETSRLLVEICKDEDEVGEYLECKAEYERLKATIGDYDEDNMTNTQLSFLRMANKLQAEMERYEEDGDVQNYLKYKANYESLKAQIGDYDDDLVIGDDDQYSVELSAELVAMANNNDIRSMVNWIGVPVDMKRLEAGYPAVSQCTMLHVAAMAWGCLELMSVLLQFGANVNAKDASGYTPFDRATLNVPSTTLETCKILLEWGAEIQDKRATIILLRGYSDEDGEGYHEVADLLSTELGGRRCEIIGMKNRADLNGMTCLVESYVKQKGRYKVVLESTKEVFAVKPVNLKRRDRTPEDCGYYIELKRGDSIRQGYAGKEGSFLYGINASVGTSMKIDSMVTYNFATKEECQSFVKEVNLDGWVAVETEGEQAAREYADIHNESHKEMKKLEKELKKMGL
mgnify:CR=1 FL=1